MNLSALRIALVGLTLGLATGEAHWDDPGAGRPLLDTFTQADFGLASFNWSVVTDRFGRVYLGNDKVLEYDGRRWRQIDIGGSYSVRSLDLDKEGRIWVGAFDELGYLDELPNGQRTYHSLRAKVPAQVKVGEIWSVYRLSKYTVFVTTDTVLMWDGTAFTYKQLPPQRRLYSFRLDDKVYISQHGVGLWECDGQALTAVPFEGADKNPILTATRGDDGSVLYISSRGMFRQTDAGIRAVDTEAASFLAANRTVAAVKLPDGNTCIATIYGGLLIVNQEGRPLRALDRSNGLPSQNITGLWLDEKGSLWAAATHALFRLNATNSVTVFNAHAGVDSGPVRNILPGVGGATSIVAEQAVLTQQAAESWRQTATFKRVAGMEEINWSAIPREGGFLVGGFGWLREVSATGSKMVRRTPNDIFHLEASPENGRGIFGAEGRRIVQYTREGAEYTMRALLELSEDAHDLHFAKDGTLWVATHRHGLYALAEPWEDDPPIHHLRRGEQLPNRFQDGEFFTLGGTTYVYAGEDVFRLEGVRPVRVNATEGYALLGVEERGQDASWAVGQRGELPPELLRFTQEGQALSVQRFAIPDLGKLGKPDKLIRTDEKEILWIAGSSGILRVDTEHQAPAPVPPPPQLVRLQWTRPEQVIDLPLDASPVLNYAGDATLSFDFRDPRNPLVESPLEGRLIGATHTWSPLRNPQVFTALREGQYQLEVRLADSPEGTREITRIPFVIRPPWHRSTLAYALYFLGIITVVWGIIHLRLRRIARRNQQLEQLVNQRTDELTRATASKSAFLANMGHEILNPLNGVVGLVESLRQSGMQPEQTPVVEQLSNCAAQIVSVVEDVLEYARIEAGKVTIRLRAFRLSEPVHAAMEIFSAAQKDNEGRISLDCEPELLNSVRFGAPDRIRQILVNYISNALKYGNDTPISIHISEGAEDRIIFRVTDSGPGIPEHEQGALFHRFNRASAARRNDIPGTGLGLAACKAYAESMGGQVWVDSKPDQGASFYLSVPVRHATQADTVATVVTTDILAGKSALIVDDHDFNRGVLADTLSRLGATSASAGTIEQAKEIFQIRTPDIVFVDFDLGGRTGAEFVEWIRTQAPSGRDVPAVATTAFELEEVKQRCEEAGMDGFLSKPITPWKIREVVARIEKTRGGGIITSTSSQQPPSLEEVGDEPAPSGAKPSTFLDLLAGGDPHRRAEIMAQSWVELRRELGSVRWRQRRGDHESSARAAHRLVSVAILVEVPEIMSAAKRLQHFTKEGHIPEALQTAGELSALLRAHGPARPGITASATNALNPND